VPEVQFFKPAGVPMSTLQVVELTVEEVETLRLVDLENLTQEEAALRMGISRRTLWNDLMGARKKVAFALINGQAIQIRGGAYSVAGAYKDRRKETCHTEMEQDPGDRDQ
jgi:predicted DNA-binding protein (UPF0251 family)